MKNGFFAIFSVFLSCLLFAAGCGGDGGGSYTCSYEKRVTDGCDGYGFGNWTAGCQTFNSDDYYITPQEVCDNLIEGGVWCELSCCVDSEYRNVDLSKGSCP